MLKRQARGALIDVGRLFRPLAPFGRIGLAVSGGPDSLALMLLASEWAASAGRELIVYTLDHRLRPEAADEAAMVAREAERLGLCCRVLSWTEAKPEAGIQAAARVARYRIIGAAMQADGTEILVTAHHRDDQAETLLMRLAHGSGISGLAGMSLFGEVEGVPVCRPLLGLDGCSLRAIVAEAGFAPAIDPSNFDEKYERVRWRRLMPALDALGLTAERTETLSRRVARADAALDLWAGEAFRTSAAIDAFGIVRLDRAKLADLPEEIALRVVMQCLDYAGGGTAMRLARAEALLDALRDAPDGFAATQAGAQVVRKGDALLFFREAGRFDGATMTLEAGRSFVWDGRFAVTVASGVTDSLHLAPAGSLFSRAEAERFAGEIDAPMQAIAAAPLVRDAHGTIRALGSHVSNGAGFEITTAFKTKPSRSGQNPGNQHPKHRA